MMHKFVYYKENIHKIYTPLKLTPYIQTIQILNKPIQPIISINIYMPLHPNDLNLINNIKNHIKHTTKKTSNTYYIPQ